MNKLFALTSVAALIIAGGCAGTRQSCLFGKHRQPAACDTCGCDAGGSTYYSPIDDGVWMDGESTIESLPTPGPATTN